uniref:Ankyrin repeat and SOCS box protein 11 n=1 Tax=Sinocyclocheilus grahami TaxID=75366 RepID=A0A672RPU2_SINGR
MAVVHAEVNVWSKPWDHRFQLYGGHVCNTLMADSWDDRTPLHDAALQGRLLPLRRLLSQGCNVGMATLDGITPLHEACVGGHFTCAKLLLEHAADANAVSFDGATPLFSACCSGNPALSSPLCTSAPLRATECVQSLLNLVFFQYSNTNLGGNFKTASCLPPGADVQCGRGLDTPLHAATLVGGAKEVELLLEHGADRTSRNSEGKKALELTTDQSIKHLLQTTGPCSLSQLSRWCIRRSLGQKGLSKTKMLCLPHILHNYILNH